MSQTRHAGIPALGRRSSTWAVAKLWNRIPIHCLYCCQAVDGESVSLGGTMAWCPNCHRVFEAPLLKAPSWVTGVLAILAINLN
jgi:hypothetical protein